MNVTAIVAPDRTDFLPGGSEMPDEENASEKTTGESGDLPPLILQLEEHAMRRAWQ
jgi:hypothetical protein